MCHTLRGRINDIYTWGYGCFTAGVFTITNQVVEEANEEHANLTQEPNEKVEEPTPKPKPKPTAKPKPSDLVNCPDCLRQMTYKNLRYSHKCSPEPPPVKKQANPKGKAKPKQPPKHPPDVYYSESDDDDASPEARDARDPHQPMLKKKINNHHNSP